MPHVQSMIRNEELRQFRKGYAPITLARVAPLYRCADDKHDIRDCINAACRWSERCSLEDCR